MEFGPGRWCGPDHALTPLWSGELVGEYTVRNITPVHPDSDGFDVVVVDNRVSTPFASLHIAGRQSRFVVKDEFDRRLTYFVARDHFELSEFEDHPGLRAVAGQPHEHDWRVVGDSNALIFREDRDERRPSATNQPVGYVIVGDSWASHIRHGQLAIVTMQVVIMADEYKQARERQEHNASSQKAEMPLSIPVRTRNWKDQE